MDSLARRVIKGVLLLLAAAYPVFIYFALMHWHWDVRYLAGILIVLIAVRLALDKATQTRKARFAWLLVVVILLLGIVLNSDLSLRFYPVLINLGMLYTFLLSLYYPPSAIERLARLTDPNMGEAGVRYTKKLTKAWCVFFLVNGSIACYTALFSSYEVWAWYNGFLAYIAIGLMFVIEFPIRLYVKRKEMKRDDAV